MHISPTNGLSPEAGVHPVLFLASLYNPSDVRNGIGASSQLLTISQFRFYFFVGARFSFLSIHVGPAKQQF